MDAILNADGIALGTMMSFYGTGVLFMVMIFAIPNVLHGKFYKTDEEAEEVKDEIFEESVESVSALKERIRSLENDVQKMKELFSMKEQKFGAPDDLKPWTELLVTNSKRPWSSASVSSDQKNCWAI